MKNYKIAFIGIGSIGTRHLKNICHVLDGRGTDYIIDVYRSTPVRDLSEEIKPLVKAVFAYEDGPKDNYDIVFVTNPTFLHYEALQKFVKHTRSFFIEKPIFDKASVDQSVFEQLNKVVSYVACPLRFHPVIRYVKENVNLNDVISARAISSSYLPDWRLGTDYRKCFAAHREMGGGVGIDLIHEWDYLTNFFGMPVKSFSIQEKISNLEIDSDDLAIYIAKTDKASIELHLDYFGRQTIRTLELYTKDDTIHCNLLGGTISYLKTNKVFRVEVDRNAYQIAELEHFLNIINNNEPNDNTPAHAFEVLKLALGQY